MNLHLVYTDGFSLDLHSVESISLVNADTILVKTFGNLPTTHTEVLRFSVEYEKTRLAMNYDRG